MGEFYTNSVFTNVSVIHGITCHLKIDTMGVALEGASAGVVLSWQAGILGYGGTRVSFTYMSACLHACMCDTCAQLPKGPEEGVRLPGTGVTDGWGCRVSAGNQIQFHVRSREWS